MADTAKMPRKRDGDRPARRPLVDEELAGPCWTGPRPSARSCSAPMGCCPRVLASILEFELRSVEHFATAAAARVSAWIEDYHTRRRHSALAMMPPVDYEQALKTRKAA